MGPYRAVAAGTIDINTGMVGQFIIQIDGGEAITALIGTHAGCFELFGTDQVRSVKDLNGKTVAVPGLGTQTGKLYWKEPFANFKLKILEVPSASCGRIR